jgi:hypothetical protein
VSQSTLRRRIARAEALAAPPPPAGVLAHPADEAREVAREAAAAFGELVRVYRDDCQLAAPDAVSRATERGQAALDRARACPPDQVGWGDLDALARDDPDAALERWGEVKEAARAELRSGHRAARTLDGLSGSCWGRAQFLAVRAEFGEAWRPRDGLEQMLVDQLALYQVQLWQWQWVVGTYADVADLRPKRPGPRRAAPEPARVTEAEALGKAAALVGQFQDLFLRTLRALQGLRRAGLVVVRRAGQVNVARQQVNLTG